MCPVNTSAVGMGWRSKVTPRARASRGWRASATFVAQAALLVGVTIGLSGNTTSLQVVAPATRVLAAQATHSRPVKSVAPIGATAPVRTTTSTAAPPPPSGAEIVPLPLPVVTTTCADALAYLAAHQAPGFVDSCGDGSALGHLGYTCWNIAGRCPNGAKIIHIACPAPFVYMNEAHNSWTLIGQGSGIDTYGQGTAAEQAFCNPRR